MHSSFDDLLEQFRDGHPDAVRHVSRVARKVVTHRGYYVAADDREDIVQETILHVFRAVTDSNFDLRQNLDRLTRVIAHRRCVDWMRRHRTEQSVAPGALSVVDSPERDVLRSEMLSRARVAIASLGLASQQLLRLWLRDGLSHREIAERVGSTEASVRVRIHKSLKRAHEFVEAEERINKVRTTARGEAREA